MDRPTLAAPIVVTTLLVLATACSNNSTNATLPSPPSSVPQVTPANSAFAATCSDLGQLEQVVIGMLSGNVAASAGVQQLATIGQRLKADATRLQQSQPEVSATISDLSLAVEQVRSALENGGDVVDVLGANISRINADIQQIPANVCGTTPSPIPT